MKANNLPAIITIKTFDSILRCNIIKILKAYGILPTWLEPTINYTEIQKQELQYLTEKPSYLTSRLECSRETHTIAPFLFIIVFDYAMSKALHMTKNRNWVSP